MQDPLPSVFHTCSVIQAVPAADSAVTPIFFQIGDGVARRHQTIHYNEDDLAASAMHDQTNT